MNLVKNVLGRDVPVEIDGIKIKPFMGVGKFIPAGFWHVVVLSFCHDERHVADGNGLVFSETFSAFPQGLAVD